MKNETPKEIKAELDEVYGIFAPSIQTVYNWINKFRRGRISTSDAERSGRPNDVTTLEMVSKIHDIVLADRRVKVREILEAVGITGERVCNILRNYLDMKELSA